MFGYTGTSRTLHMHAVKIMLGLFLVFTVLPSFAYHPRIAQLIAEKQAKMEKLEKCQGTTKNLKIAGISTLGITAVGIGVNIAEAVVRNNANEEVAKAKKARDEQQTIKDKHLAEQRQQECEKDSTKYWTKEGYCKCKPGYIDNGVGSCAQSQTANDGDKTGTAPEAEVQTTEKKEDTDKALNNTVVKHSDKTGTAPEAEVENKENKGKEPIVLKNTAKEECERGGDGLWKNGKCKHANEACEVFMGGGVGRYEKIDGKLKCKLSNCKTGGYKVAANGFECISSGAVGTNAGAGVYNWVGDDLYRSDGDSFAMTKVDTLNNIRKNEADAKVKKQQEEQAAKEKARVEEQERINAQLQDGKARREQIQEYYKKLCPKVECNKYDCEVAPENDTFGFVVTCRGTKIKKHFDLNYNEVQKP